VIDTPGLGDTSGLKSDAKFLAGLEAYLKNHEELRDKVPNVVLIFSKFPDNRMQGSSSGFVQTIRKIDLFRDKIFDMKYSNQITVLTHFMMESDRKTRRNPTSKLNYFRDMIEEYTLFPKPIRICVAENKPDDLPIINGYYLLPNLEHYPKNLFDKIQEATGEHDLIGEAIIRAAFKDPHNFVITEKVFPIQDVNFGREAHYLHEILEKSMNTQVTEISNITAAVYNSSISETLKGKYPGSFKYLQGALNLQGIITSEDIPRTQIPIVQLFNHVKHNPLIQELLEKAFALRIPDFGNN
jgi:hypothetical protein